ncbi:MAG: lipoprotein insertase outer membrane protein LolB [Gammaproteobacteria bacterium]|nr:lipoprotein insertase outer membrane protein LolB [Gammaproteobacteria bacterium]
MKFAVLIGAALTLSGCATLFNSAEYPPLSQQQQSALALRQQTLADVSAWVFNGRLSLKTADDAWTGKVRWRQDGKQFRLHFSAPTGQGAVQLMSNPQFGVEMRTAEGAVQYADDAETLLYDHTGWRLPVSGLRLWVVGLPNGEEKISQLSFDDQGRIETLAQYQWRIQYLQYRKVNGHDLPRKIQLQNADLDMRIVIDHWDML